MCFLAIIEIRPLRDRKSRIERTKVVKLLYMASSFLCQLNVSSESLHEYRSIRLHILTYKQYKRTAKNTFDSKSNKIVPNVAEQAF